MTSPLETYLSELRAIRATGAAQPETSFYTPLANLLNEIGKTLKPRVRCVIQLTNRGAGMPDGGVFTAEQSRALDETQPLCGQMPERGVIEAKAVDDDSWFTAEGEQVTRYWGRYGLVLVTNYRDFVLVGRGEGGRPHKLETFRLAASEADFWAAAAKPRATADRLGSRFVEFLKRVMLHAAPLTDPRDLAWFLASYARDAAARIEDTELPALASLRAGIEDALGLRFEGEKGEHFFRSTLVQTLFYGIFSAWVLWCREPESKRADFQWRIAAWTLHVPMIRSLFEQFATATTLGPLGLVEVLDWAATALNRVDRKEFFRRFEDEHAVPYFYEPFLQAFDPELRKELGVWYTPPEIVRYMVERVDRVLREELSIKDGFADERVFVLDPACGTGAYLVEVLKKIADTRGKKGRDALLAADVKKAARERVFGFEVLPAPFVVSHLQIGLLLARLGAPLSDVGNERAAVFLTNALTGWEPPKEEKKPLLFAEMTEERDAADRVKREVPILVILGNPPYNAFAGVALGEERDLVEPYKKGLISEWKIKKFNLDDLYVRFFRLAERKIAEKPPFKGIVCYISNFSYLSDPSFVVARQRFLAEFDRLWFDCLNGDSRETGKLTPEGKPDPSIFSTASNREGIRLGTAIGLMVRTDPRAAEPRVRYRDFWGVSKRQLLLASLEKTPFNDQYSLVAPEKANRFSFRTISVTKEYLSWPRVVDICSSDPISGLQEMRHGALIDIDRAVLESRMLAYFDQRVDPEHLAEISSALCRNAAGYEARKIRARILGREVFDVARIVRYSLYPFDTRWAYFSTAPTLWNRPRPVLVRQRFPGNRFLITRMASERPSENIAMLMTRDLPDYHLLRPNIVAIPTLLRDDVSTAEAQDRQLVLGEKALATPHANLSGGALNYLRAVGHSHTATTETADRMWTHTLAIGYAPAYRSENADGVLSDWLRIPLPLRVEDLVRSAGLGGQVADLLDTETQVEGVTAGEIRPELRVLGIISRAGGGQLDERRDLALTAGWGHAGKEGVTMPAKGKTVERNYSDDERKSLGSSAELLGGRTLDIFLNDIAFWKNVPLRVWEYYIGGYQVIKKWLSYREKELLGRDLTPEEVREVTNMIRRIAAIVLMELELDDNYRRVKVAAYEWPRT